MDGILWSESHFQTFRHFHVMSESLNSKLLAGVKHLETERCNLMNLNGYRYTYKWNSIEMVMMIAAGSQRWHTRWLSTKDVQRLFICTPCWKEQLKGGARSLVSNHLTCLQIVPLEIWKIDISLLLSLPFDIFLLQRKKKSFHLVALKTKQSVV